MKTEGVMFYQRKFNLGYVKAKELQDYIHKEIEKEIIKARIDELENADDNILDRIARLKRELTTLTKGE